MTTEQIIIKILLSLLAISGFIHLIQRLKYNCSQRELVGLRRKSRGYRCIARYAEQDLENICDRAVIKTRLHRSAVDLRVKMDRFITGVDNGEDTLGWSGYRPMGPPKKP